MARDALALMLDISAEDIEVEVRRRLPEDLAQAVDEVRQARAQAEATVAAATEASADLAGRLTAFGMSGRDAGMVIGVSRQRVGPWGAPRRILTAEPSGRHRVQVRGACPG
jgi:hypothetical protein